MVGTSSHRHHRRRGGVTSETEPRRPVDARLGSIGTADHRDRPKVGHKDRRLPLAWREITAVVVVLGLAWLGYYSWSRDVAIFDALSGLGLSAIEKEAIEEEAVMSDARALANDFGVSDELKSIIREEEGQVLTVYRDVSGLPTVGAGHLVTPADGLRVGDRISRERMNRLLEQDLDKAASAVRRLLRNTRVKQHEFDALVDLVYNVGPGNVSRDRSPALNRAIDAEDYEAIAEQLVYSRAQNGQQAEGLINRSERRRRMFREGDYADPRTS
ncbi:lysozyme [Sphingomicrobium sp. XHP0239]|uniref:lysozyme n=1 Tax=Sphingomicrobium maritimum TaxID=3133972 RepID=UPI0031CCD835